MLNEAMDEMGVQIGNQTIEQMRSKSSVIPISTAKALLSPFTIRDKTVHSVGLHSADGTVPSMLAIITWLVSLTSSVPMYFTKNRAQFQGLKRWKATLLQNVFGITLSALYSLLLVWMCGGWYGM